MIRPVSASAWTSKATRTAIARADAERDAEVLRVGVEAAGHYHRTLVARLRSGGYDVIELSPRAVKESLSQQLLARLKSDERDVGLMAELMIRGSGRSPAIRSDALATQAVWVAHRRRKVHSRVALANQVIGQLDLVFPGLDGCFDNLLRSKAGRVIISEICDPDRVRRQGVDGLRRLVARRGVTLRTAKAEQIVEAARIALRLLAAEHAALGQVLAVDVALLTRVEAEITAAESALADVLVDTPAGVLISLPGVKVVRASNYGAGIGDPSRFDNASGACRASGLVPALRQSSNKSWPGQHISREGSVALRQAIIELGRGLSRFEPDFVAYRQRLLDANKPAGIVAIAVGHRAHRFVFAMLRDQTTYNPTKWNESVAAGMTVTAKTLTAHQNDVTCPPPSNSLTDGGETHNQTHIDADRG